MASHKITRLIALTALPFVLYAQDVRISVDASRKTGTWRPIWTYFGYDEPNYTYTPNGSKLIGELAGASSTPVYIRTHNLLTTGDGTPALKWGSTNAYTEDAAGKPVYDWKIVDKIFDTILHAGAKPFVEVGFMPKALSTTPDPYQHSWPKTRISTGWAYPPNDYKKWGELIRQWALHSVDRYGKQEVESWYWEVWNEPDIEYWRGTPEEYDAMYDYAADAIKSVLPAARVGGPATTDPSNPKAAAYLRQFLNHCESGRNAATGKTGSPLDFITFHAKGRPSLVDGHVQMGIGRNLQNVDTGMEVVQSFPKFRQLPIVLSESDPEGCAACSARTNPANAYRNGPLYACYTAVMLKHAAELSQRHGVNLQGLLTWAFEFEGQPYFDGFRTLATNGVDKPVLNVFRMAGLLGGDSVKVESSGAVGLDQILKTGVRAAPDVDGMATRSQHEVSILVWNYHDDDKPGEQARLELHVEGLPADARRVLMSNYRIDGTHSNAYAAWKAMGSPQQPSDAQQKLLEDAGQLQLIESPVWIPASGGNAIMKFALPRQAVSLVTLSW